MDNLNEEIIKENKSKSNLLLKIALILAVFVVFSYLLLSAPFNNKSAVVHISSNDSLSKISSDLKDKRVIRNVTVFKSLVSIFGDRHISRGDYLFDKNSNVIKVALQISMGHHNIEPIKVTLREGIKKEEIIKILSNKIPNFDKEKFMKDERSKEGYLFPDTYFFYPFSTTDEILMEINNNFKKKTSSLNKEILSSGKSFSDILIMASILEKEASGKDDSPIIAGILWKRIEKGMPLQVDAAPETYKIKGLPISPISNPGISTINSAIHPKESNYLFYLHDKDGNVHYATNFSEHKNNIVRYLK